MTRTITVRGREYTVVDEPRLNGEIAPHVYNSRGGSAGVLVYHEQTGLTSIVGVPQSWTASDIRSAVEQILA
jgi:hypothetical protein